MANYNSYNAASVVLIITAIFGIISFFSGWMCIANANIGVGVLDPDICFTGYGMLDSKYNDFFGGYAFIPLYVLILSVITLIIAFLPKMGVNVDAGKYSLMLIIIGLAILILAIVYGLSTFEYDLYGFKDTGFGAFGEGLIFAIIAGVLNIIVGALPALTRRL